MIPGERGRDGGTAADAPVDEPYGALRERIARAVARVCPSWMAADREDLVQATWLKVRSARAGAEGNEELASSYLQRAAYSALIDELRARRRRAEVALDPVEGDEVQETRESGPEARARGREIGRGLRSCLAAMVDDRRVALTLRLLGHSVPEAARRLGWPGKRVENLVYRGLADLRACLRRKGLQP
jgi:RNA polymerase sigma-70 factor (ECF subfamily)